MKFGSITSVCIIGGGEPMIHFGRYLKNRDIDVSAIIAPRHEEAVLPRTGITTGQALRQNNIHYVCCGDVNAPDFIEREIRQKQFSIIVCFGPAWVFGAELLDACRNNIVNFNGIPIPRYLGGAHYTWQILNQDRSSGMIVQHITQRIDKGNILKMEHFELPKYVRIPLDYFEENYHIACGFLENFANELIDEREFPEISFEELMPSRLYFPRLSTAHQGYVDWSWDGREIELFCCAFDEPYQGASSFVGNLGRVFIKDVTLILDEISPHPFCSGLVVRKHDGALYIAVKHGLLKVKTVYDEENKNMIAGIREGLRFFVDKEFLDHARAFQPEIKAWPTQLS